MVRSVAGLASAAVVVVLVGCGGSGEAAFDDLPLDDASSEAGDAGGEAARDALAEAIGEGGDEFELDASCAKPSPDAALVDGIELGLPTVDVAVGDAALPPQTSVTADEDHHPFQVGVLCTTGADNVRDVQAVEHALAPMGIPYAVTTSPLLAITHDVAMFFPEGYDYEFDANAATQLREWLKSGGTLVLRESPESKLLHELGGVASSTFNLPHASLTLTTAGEQRFPSLDRPEERTIPLGGDSAAHLYSWALDVDAAATSAVVLAEFDDGRAAIVENTVGAGRVYTLGVDLRDTVLRNQLGHSIEAGRHYVNAFEPGTDSWLLMLRDVYDARSRFGVRLHTAPGATRGALLLSHDLDWGPSYDNARAYADEEAKRGARATFFVHTKYVSDSQDVAFFDGTRGAALAGLMARGGRVGSHTVAHSPVLHGFPLGDGTEAYPAYRPTNVDVRTTIDGTLFGELRVSKSLIDGALDGACVAHETTAFRAGNLDWHASLPPTLARVGYRVDSTRAVGEVLSAFPFRLMTDWPDELDTDVLEIPVSIEDQKAPTLDARVPDALDLVSANADNGAPTVLLIHPNVLDAKLDAERQILAGLPDGVVATSLDDYAAFWRARSSAKIVAIDFDSVARTLSIRVQAGEAVRGLSLKVDDVVSAVTAPASARLVVVPRAGKLVILPDLSAGEVIDVHASWL